MTFPLQSPEKASLVPVIAMLLQFNSKEMEQVRQDNSDREVLFALPLSLSLSIPPSYSLYLPLTTVL